MKIIILLISLILLVSAIIILYTETEKSALGSAPVMCTLAGFGFRIVTEED